MTGSISFVKSSAAAYAEKNVKIPGWIFIWRRFGDVFHCSLPSKYKVRDEAICTVIIQSRNIFSTIRMIIVLYVIDIKDTTNIVYVNHFFFHIYLSIEHQNARILSYVWHILHRKILIAYLQYVNYVISSLMLNERG